MKRKLVLTVSIVLILSLLAACGSSPKNTPTLVPMAAPLPSPKPLPSSTPLPTSTPLPITTMDPSLQSFETIVDLGEHQMTLSCKGQGEPTVILGYENIGGFHFWNDGTLKDLKDISRTCRYTRIETTRKMYTTEDQVQELHELLTQAGVPGPYVLVGHEISGLNVLLYTYHYPTDVVGLVCVSCFTHILDNNIMDALGEEQPDESAAKKQVRNFWAWDDYPDMINLLFRTSFAQARKVTSLGDLPFVVLASGDFTYFPESWSSLGFDKIWFDSMDELSKLSSRGRMEIVPNNDITSIPYSDAVTKAIQEVVEAARQAP
jgi:pimeloyl-ACP methyl ester carboxylesterase